MRRLHLRWSSDPRDTAPAAAPGDLVLVFARSAAPPPGGPQVVLADDLLDWAQRSSIEQRAGELIEALRARLGNDDLIEASEYELRVEWLNLLLAHAVGAALRDAGPFAELVPSALTPTAVAAGVSSALGLDAPPLAAAGIVHRRQAGARDAVARLIVDARAATSAARSIRVLTIPGLKLSEALGELSSGQLAGVGVAALAELGHGEAAKLILRHRLPAVALPAPPAGAPAGGRLAPGELTGSPALDAALGDAASAPLARGERRTREVAAALTRIERLPRLRAIVVPTAALGVTRLLGRWARRHGIAFASYQHGIYGLVEGDGGDRRADVLFGWGPAVAGQVARWAAPQPRLEAVGVPGLARPPRSAGGSLRRVLVATTNNPFGTALAPWSAREDFLDAVADGISRLRAAGVEVELRLHPVEAAEEYAIMDARAGREPLPLAPPGSFADVAARADMVVTPFSSVAFEAAALSIPVAMWIPRIPEPVRSAQFLPPLSEDLPGTFADAAGFEALARQALEDPDHGLAAAESLSRSLLDYVAPLDRDHFAVALAQLGVS